MGKLRMLKPKTKMLGTSGASPKLKGNTWGEGRGGRPWRRLRDQILLRDAYTCRACGLVSQHLEVDHIINVAQGGTDDPSNLQSLCSACHRSKTAQESVAALNGSREG